MCARITPVFCRSRAFPWEGGGTKWIGSLRREFQDRRRGACSSQTTAAKRTSLTGPSTWVAMLGQPKWSHMYSVSSSSPPSGVMRPVLIVTCGMNKSPSIYLMLRGQFRPLQPPRTTQFASGAEPTTTASPAQTGRYTATGSPNKTSIRRRSAPTSTTNWPMEADSSTNPPSLDKITPPDWLQWRERNRNQTGFVPQPKLHQDFAQRHSINTILFDSVPHPSPNLSVVFGRL